MTTAASHDRILEDESWKQTAARWRKRALQEGGKWRRQCAKLEADLDDANERGANLVEELDRTKAVLNREMKERLTKAQSEKLRAERDAAKKAAERTENAEESEKYYRREADKAHAEKDKAVKAAGVDRLEMQKQRDRAIAALRVVAARLGVAWDRKEMDDPHELAAAIDTALVRALSK